MIPGAMGGERERARAINIKKRKRHDCNLITVGWGTVRRKGEEPRELGVPVSPMSFG